MRTGGYLRIRRAVLEVASWTLGLASWTAALMGPGASVLMGPGASILMGPGASMLSAQEPEPIALAFEPIPRLVAGEHADLVLVVHLAPEVARSLMITPDVQGQSVEIVRGRFLRSNAVDPDANPLRFRIHVIARRPGAAVLYVRLQGYVCRPTCALSEIEYAQPLRVLSAE